MGIEGPSELPLSTSQRGWSRLLGVSRLTLRKAIERGDLMVARPGVRDQIIFRDDVLAWLAARRVQPQGDDHLQRLRKVRDRT